MFALRNFGASSSSSARSCEQLADRVVDLLRVLEVGQVLSSPRAPAVPRRAGGAESYAVRSAQPRSGAPPPPAYPGRHDEEGAGPAAHDYDWLVIGSGFGGSVSALRLAEKGYRVACPRVRPSIRRRRLRQVGLEPASLLLAAAPGPAGHLPADAVQGRLHRLRQRRRRRQPRLRQHALPGSPGVLPRPAVGGARRLGERASAPLRHRRADARRRRLRGDDPGGRAAARVRRRDRRRRHLRAHAGRRLLRRARQAGAPTPTSAARARRGPAASAAGAAWSAAATAPRTPWSRTTCGSPSAAAPRCCPSDRRSRSAPSAPPTAPTATR